MSKFKKILIGIFAILFLVLFVCFFVGTAPEAEDIKWGVNFSHKHAKLLGLDWKETYLALLDDLKVRRIKLITHWDELEPERDKYFFEDLDWQMEKAAERDAEILLVIGMKTPRWPECHLPEWAKGLSKAEQQESILKLIETIVLRYKIVQGPTLNSTVWGWQVENEPFFPFGQCPWKDAKFLKKEIELVKKLDEKNRPVLTTESGEAPLWIRAAIVGDMVGTTMYKKVWIPQIGIYVYYPFPEIFYYRKMKMIEKLFHKKVICVELQAEPWGPKLLYDISLEEQEKTMNLQQFKNIIGFAKNTGFDEFYLWGAEWWYWLRVKQGNSNIWDEAGKLWSLD